MFFSGMNVTCFRVCWVACALVFGAAAARAAPDELVRKGAPAAPVSSKDGSITVHAPAEKAGYRAPVLVFAQRTREELQAEVRLKLVSQAVPLEIAIGGKSDGDTRVLTARLNDGSGAVRERIELPDPEAANLALFRRALCVALLRAWMADAGGTDETMKDLPAWLIDGLIRHMDREARQADLDRTLRLWSNACLPPAADLFEMDSTPATREPAVAAVLASWFLEKRAKGESNPFEALLRGAAKGAAWSPAVAGRLLAETSDALAFDEALDVWLLSEGRQVIKPGVTTDGIVQRFRLQLLLYPSEYGKTFDTRKACLTFQEAVQQADDPQVRLSARAKAVAVCVAACGRDGTLLAVSEAYVHFLEALAKGAKPGELTRLLMDAEGLRREMERKTSSGEVLELPANEETAGAAVFRTPQGKGGKQK